LVNASLDSLKLFLHSSPPSSTTFEPPPLFSIFWDFPAPHPRFDTEISRFFYFFASSSIFLFFFFFFFLFFSPQRCSLLFF
jgi:hypothetical protein